VPQGVNASFFHQAGDRWALLGSVGWQQWSKFGYVEVGVESSNPLSLTKNLDYKDTWHVAAGAQYQLDAPWRLDFGVAYDSEFQDPGLADAPGERGLAVRRAQKQETKAFSWGLAAEYLYSGSLDVDKRSDTPVALGGRGNLIGSYDNVRIYFLNANFSWKF
jgi:long-chain fatty acid transport protein